MPMRFWFWGNDDAQGDLQAFLDFCKARGYTDIQVESAQTFYASRPAPIVTPPPVPVPGLHPGQFGADISHHQPAKDINWQAVKAEGSIKFVFIRASYGTTFADKELKGHWNGAGSIGLPRGLYHFLRASPDGRTQADYFLAAIAETYPGELPFALDVEREAGLPLPKLADIQAFLARVLERTGRKCLLYTSVSILFELDNPDLSQCDLWLADYTPPVQLPPHWTRFEFVQPGVARVAGFPRMIDIDVFQREGPWWLRQLPFQVWTKDQIGKTEFRDAPSGAARVNLTRVINYKLDVREITVWGWLRVSQDNEGPWWIYNELCRLA